MAYDEALAQRIRDVLKDTRGVTEKRMFGGIAFLRPGHMFIGISDKELMARVGPTNHARALAKKHVRKMDFTGKPMRGYVFVGAEGVKTSEMLRRWVQECMAFADGLPPKAAK